MTNPYHPDSLAYRLYEDERYAKQAAIIANNQVEIPANYQGWIGAMLVMGGGLGLVRGLVDHAPMSVTLGFALRYALVGMALVTAFYAVVVGPRMAFAAVGWAMRKSVVVRSMIIGAAITTAFGLWLSLAMHETLLRGVVRLGPVGAVLGLVVGGTISLSRRRRRIGTT